MSVNKATLIGNLGADPEVRYTASGTPVANFRMATNERWTDKEGKKQERVEWHRVVAWGKLGETVGEYLTKGRQVYVEGKIQTREWKDRDNVRRFTTEIVAGEVKFLGSGKRPEGQAEEANPQMELDAPPPAMSDDDVPF